MKKDPKTLRALAAGLKSMAEIEAAGVYPCNADALFDAAEAATDLAAIREAISAALPLFHLAGPLISGNHERYYVCGMLDNGDYCPDDTAEGALLRYAEKYGPGKKEVKR